MNRTFTLSGIINEFLNIDNHLLLWKISTPFTSWNPNYPITFKYFYIYSIMILRSCIKKLREITLYLFLPYVVILFISQKERKMGKRLIAVLEAVCFLFLFLLSLDTSRHSMQLSLYAYRDCEDWVAYLIIIGILRIINSFLYSFCFNFRLLKKYLISLNIQKYEKLIFRTSVILLLILNYLYAFFVYTYFV